MPIARKPAHIGSGLGKDRGRRQARYARDGIQKRGEIAKEAAARGRLLIYPGDLAAARRPLSCCLRIPLQTAVSIFRTWFRRWRKPLQQPRRNPMRTLRAAETCG
jgi:hypothetical protein